MKENTVLVTGASTGIGEACVLCLDKLGVHVFAGVRKEVDGDRLRRQASDRLTPVLIDIADEASIKNAVTIVAAAVGNTGLTGLVNNAGIAVACPLEFVPIEELRRQMEVNLIGQVAVTQSFLPLLRQARGRIVNMGSIAGRIATPFLGPYAASKFAFEAVTDSLRLELRPWGIRVAIIEPGKIATPIWHKSLVAAEEIFNSLPPQAHALYGPVLSAKKKRTAHGSGLSAEKVTQAVVHALISSRPKSRYVIGRDARLGITLTLLPDWIRDWLIA